MRIILEVGQLPGDDQIYSVQLCLLRDGTSFKRGHIRRRRKNHEAHWILGSGMEILREKICADKKLLGATNMGLTEKEAEAFWPVYESYQKDLQKINQRIVKRIAGYAADYRNKSLTDEEAKKLIDESCPSSRLRPSSRVRTFRNWARCCP